MKIGIISDTHGCSATWRQVYSRYFHDADLILHAGDVLYHGPRNAIPGEYDPQDLAEELNRCPVPMVTAAGNCDAEVDGMVLDLPVQSPYAHVFVEGMRILVNHGHRLDEAAQSQMAAKLKIKIFVTGHTHIARLEKRDGIIFLNPGAPAAAMSKRPDGCGTVAWILDNKVEILNVSTGKVLAGEEL